jgi:nickel-type superoxide dismutase maturation protease
MSAGGGVNRSLALIGIVIAAALAARRWLDVVEVRGRSMAPSLLPGDRLLVMRAEPRVGDVVIASDPRDPTRELVKRVTALDAAGVRLRGDNPGFSTDERTFGAVPAGLARWRAAVRYWPPRRMGTIPPAPLGIEVVDEGGEPACTVPDALVAGA